MSRLSLPELLALFDREQRREVAFADVRREVTPEVVRLIPIKPILHEGAVVYSQLDAGNADAVIAEQIAHFDALGFDFEWKAYSHDALPDLTERLRRVGFEAEEPESVVVLDLEEAPEMLWSAPAGAVREIADPAGVQDVMSVLNGVWGEGDAWLGPVLESELRETPDLIRVYVAYVDETPASAAWMRFHPGSHFASLWGGSTVERHRGRGLYTALLATRAREARARGYRFLTVDASPMSRPILERFGFRLLTVTQAFKWHRKTPS